MNLVLKTRIKKMKILSPYNQKGVASSKTGKLFNCIFFSLSKQKCSRPLVTTTYLAPTVRLYKAAWLKAVLLIFTVGAFHSTNIHALTFLSRMTMSVRFCNLL